MPERGNEENKQTEKDFHGASLMQSREASRCVRPCGNTVELATQ
jgi:hypothetical protein